MAGAMLKRAGMRSGFPDLFIPVPTSKYHGLMIEMKVGYNKPTEHQKYWLKLLSNQGYMTCLCYGADEAIKSIRTYLAHEKTYKKDALEEIEEFVKENEA